MADDAPTPSPLPEQRIQVGAAISWAFDRLKSQFWPFVGLAAVVFVLWIVQQGADLVVDGTTEIVALGLVFVVAGLIAQAGVQRAALRSTQGVRPSMDALFTTRYLGRFILLAICNALAGLLGAAPGLLIALMSGSSDVTGGLIIGILLAFAGAIVVYFLIQLGPYYVLDKGYGVGEAMGASFRVVSKNIGPAILMTLFAGLVLLLASCCGCFTLVTLPYTALFTAHLYRQFNGEPIA